MISRAEVDINDPRVLINIHVFFIPSISSNEIKDLLNMRKWLLWGRESTIEREILV